MELALLRLDEQGVVQEATENGADVGDVFHEIAGENQDIIQINKDKLVNHVPQQIVD